MVKRFDHVTIAVRDLDRAKAFFGLLGFVEDKAVVISGPIFSAYMGVDGIEMRNALLDFHSRKLIFVKGPEGITVELSEWH